MTANSNTADREIITTRIVNAPRELVWLVWTHPEHIIKWWGPNGFTNTIHEMTVKPGGIWKFIMHGPDGTDYPNRIIYEKVVEPELLEFLHDSGVENDPNGFHNRVVFEDVNGKTKITMTAVLASAAAREYVIREHDAIEGGKQTLSKMEQYLENMHMTPLVVERTYNAPVQKVWNALTNSTEMKKWYFDIPAFKAEPGFEFTFTGESPDGKKYIHLCRITDAEPGKKLRHSWKYEGHDGISYVTWELFEEGTMTRVKLTHEGLETFPPLADFDRKNFEQGWSEITGVSLKNYLETN
jgi:uncharacterized protein YndB with AHSA1/START domain